MKSIFTLAALLCATWANAQGVYQIPNSDFEGDWTTNERGQYVEVTPESWNSFYKAQGSATGLAFLVKGQIGPLSKAPEAHSGKGAALITSVENLIGSISNGNLTTGIVNMGSTTADNPENYNFSDMNSEDGCCKFLGLPDAVRFWVKFDSKDPSMGNASANMILHTDAGYSDPSTRMGVEAEAASRIAKAFQEITPNNSWVEYVVPFIYNENDLYQSYKGQKYLLASFSTNKTPGKGTGGDALAVDDIQMIYYSDLSSLSYDGKEYFNSDNTNYTIDAVYDASKLNCTSNGKGATIEKEYDRKTGVLTITVKGNDFSEEPTNVHTYTVQFKQPKSVTSYSNSLLVNAFGSYTAPTQNDIYLIQEADDSYSFLLEDFIFNKVSMGNIEILNLKHENVNNTVVYSAESQMVYIQGLGTALPVSLEATQKGEDMTADIHIVMGQDAEVVVTFLPSLVLSGQDKVEAMANRYNVTLSRTFVKGWNTICLPYTTTPAALGAKSVQEFVSVDEGGLNFAEVETLEANKPYLIYFDKDITTPVYAVGEITSTTPVAVTKGDYTFVGSYDAVISMSSKYGVATIDDVQKVILGGKNATLKATRAYFTKKGELPAQVRINLFGESGNGTTGIVQMENNGVQTYDVYTLQGVQVLKGASSLNGLQKGIYIVNGKKVVIK